MSREEDKELEEEGSKKFYIRRDIFFNMIRVQIPLIILYSL